MNRIRTAVSTFCAALFRPPAPERQRRICPEQGIWPKIVELLGSYSNQTYVLDRLITITSLKTTERATDQVKRKPQQRHRRLTSEQTRELIQRYKTGETLRQLGDAFKVHRKTVSVILKRQGIPTRYRKLTDDDIDLAIELYQSGHSLVAVATEIGVKHGTIRNALTRRGIATRPVGTNGWTRG